MAAQAHADEVEAAPAVHGGGGGRGRGGGRGVDPRAEPVRRLLEYQKYKAAGEEALGERDILERTVFARKVRVMDRGRGRRGSPTSRSSSSSRRSIVRSSMPVPSTPTRWSPTASPSATPSRASRTCCGCSAGPPSRSPSPALEQRHTRADVIATFLAILEMAKLKLVRIFQASLDESARARRSSSRRRTRLGDDVPAPGGEDYR